MQNALMPQLQRVFQQSRKIPKIYSTDICMQEYICSFVPLRLDLAGSFVHLDLADGSVWGGPRKTEYVILMCFFPIDCDWVQEITHILCMHFLEACVHFSSVCISQRPCVHLSCMSTI